MLPPAGSSICSPATARSSAIAISWSNLAGNLHQPSKHRSVYLCYLRNSPPPELAAFDLPDFTVVTGQRDVTTLPTQALYLLNSPFVVEQSRAFRRAA